ncbi:hypothetical protein [Pseudomonas sp. MWU12-2323]|uniref:hypothetical protein n=1 Tax=Pseudomonas sp. MWU12-2323 TaxID=2651296 RepID=UPI00128DF03D|nr:hypothetical protein [Pseudomonas sp. MWU12-2323]MPQ71496.1 hypothetical protein [Pseudomonas sp. MWU12-2323]
MKKTLIALALLSLAGTASAAEDILVQADVYRGSERIYMISDVVDAGTTADLHKTQSIKYMSAPSAPSDREAGGTSEWKAEEKTLVVGFEAKVTPRLLENGKISINTDYKYTTLTEMKSEKVNGVLVDYPKTHVLSGQSQQIVKSGTHADFDNIDQDHRDTRVVITAIKMM